MQWAIAFFGVQLLTASDHHAPSPPYRRSRGLAATLRTWRGYAAYSANLRSKAALLVAGLRSALLCRAFNSWVAHAQRTRELESKASGCGLLQ